MKIARFILFFGFMSVLLTACASATAVAQPTPQEPDTDMTVPSFPDNDTPVLTWQRAGGIAGFCDNVTVFAGGAFNVENCMGEPPARSGQLAADQQAQLTGWVTTFKPFEDGDDDTTLSFPDRMFLKTTFEGVGTREASPEEMTVISNFAAALAAKPEPVSGEYPEAALKAREFLAKGSSFSVDEIKIVSVEAVEWSDSCLGLGRADESCAQMITPGYKIILETQGKSYELHTDATGENIRQVP